MIAVGSMPDEDTPVSVPALRMGDRPPPTCPDWFAWWLKNEFRPFQREMRKSLTTRKVAAEIAKPLIYGGATLLATQFPALKALLGLIAP
jgi:hypothetical protein